MVEQTALQWTKEPPTEKDLGKFFLVKTTGYNRIYRFVEYWKLENFIDTTPNSPYNFGLGFVKNSLKDFIEKYDAEFLGPLPE